MTEPKIKRVNAMERNWTLWVVAMAIACLSGPLAAQSPIETGPLRLSPDELQERVKANGLKLQDLIRSRTVVTSGVVQGVGEGFSQKSARVPVIEFRTPNGVPVKAHLAMAQRADAAKLDPGDIVSVACRDLQLLTGSLVFLHVCELATSR